MEFDFLNYLKYAYDGAAPVFILLCLSFIVRMAMSVCTASGRRFADRRKSVALIAGLTVAGALLSVFVLFLLGLFLDNITLRYILAFSVSCFLHGFALRLITGREFAFVVFNAQIQMTLCLFYEVVVLFLVKFAFAGNIYAHFAIKYVLLAAVAVLEHVYLRPVFARLDGISRSNRILMLAFPAVSIFAMLLVSVYPIPYTVGFISRELLKLSDIGMLATFLLFSVSVFVSYINFFRVVSGAAKEREEQRELLLERERNKYFEQQSDMAKSNMELVKKQIHDLRHHNMVILGYLQNNDIVGVKKYLSSYDKKLESDIMTNFCVNSAVNNLLVGTTKAANQDGIETIVETAVPAKCKVDDSELVVVFANIYENAIEACRKLPYGSKKWIKLSCKHNGGKLLIESANSCVPGVRFEDDEMPKSSKARGGGQGTRSVARVIRKYGGVCSFSETDGVFKFRAILPV